MMTTDDVLTAEKLTSKDLQDAFNVSKGTVRNWTKSGVRGHRLRSFKVGEKRFYLSTDVDAFIAACSAEDDT